MIFQVGSASTQSATWWNASWRFRFPVRVDASGYSRQEKPVEIPVNFTQLMAGVGESGEFSEASIRVLEVDGQGAIINDSVAFQFDRDAAYNASTQASGTLTILMSGTTAAAATREFHVYFGRTDHAYTPAPVSARIELTDSIPDEGQLSYRIDTEMGSWFYHKQGGGYSSLLDNDGNDWINYHPTYPGSTAGGPSRGIPNCVYPRGYFHPGSTSSISSIVSQGPLKITLRSVTITDNWECRWEIFPRYARLTVLSGDSTYWLLYEGTPGGKLDINSDRVVRSDGSQVLVSESWIADVPGDEWVYFQDPVVSRSLYMAHHNDDTIYDSYRPMDSLMTVFGFGRQRAWSYLTEFPTQLTVGLVDGVSFTETAGAITSAYKPLSVTLLPAEVNLLPGSPELASPSDGSLVEPDALVLRWHPTPLSLVYGVQLAENAAFTGTLLRNDSTLVDTTLSLSGLTPAKTYFWRAFARNAWGRGEYSATWQFTTSGVAPAAVLLASPADQSSVPSDSVRLSWFAPSGPAVRYWFELGYDQAFLFHSVDSTITDTTTVAYALVANHLYYWRVRGGNGAGWGPFSEVRRLLTTVTSAAESRELPARFSLEQNFPNPFNPRPPYAMRFRNWLMSPSGCSP